MAAERNQSSRISLLHCHQSTSVERQSAARQGLPLMTWFSSPGQKALQQSPHFRQLWRGKRASKRIGTDCYVHVKQAEAKVAFQLHFGCDPGRLRSWVPVPWTETVKGILEHLVLKCPFISVKLLFLKCSLCIIHHQFSFCLDTSGIIPQRLKIIIPLTFLHRKN